MRGTSCEKAFKAGQCVIADAYHHHHTMACEIYQDIFRIGYLQVLPMQTWELSPMDHTGAIIQVENSKRRLVL